MKAKRKKKPTPTTRRGVSWSEYQCYARLVRLGKNTWKQLERDGHVKPDARYSEAYRRVMARKAKAK